MSVEDLTNLSNLIELNVRVNPEIKEGSMSTWSKMRNLRLWFPWGKVENRDDAALDILPQNMQSMEELQSLELFDYEGVSLPNCICQFQNLKNLRLSHCIKLEELPALEIGCEAASDSFPKLEELRLDGLNSLESIVWNANTMLQLQILRISYCRVLKTFKTEELPNLRELHISGCAQLKKLFMDNGGGFPKLKTLYLESLDSLESVVCNAKTMLHVQRLTIWGCRVLKALRMEELPNLRELNVWGCAELKELFMESGGRFSDLQTLDLSYLDSLESIVCNAETMLQLQSLTISGCGVLEALRIEELPNLKDICIKECPQLEVEIGGLPVLQKLSLTGLEKAESIAIPSSAWNQETMPSLEVIEITGCPLLKRMPREMEKLPKLKEIVGKLDWWDGISWENDNVKSKLSHLFKGSDVEECDEGSALETDGDEGSELKEDGEVDEDTELGKDGEIEECEGNGEDDHPI